MKMNIKLTAIIIFLLSCYLIHGQNIHNSNSNNFDSISRDLKRIYERNELAGFAVSIFGKDSIFYQSGFGYADKSKKIPYTVSSNQLIASISKTFIGVSLMIAIEQNKMKLDDDVNEYLNFKVINPNFPDTKITLRHLANHTSGITDPKSYNKTYLFSKKLKKKNWPQQWHDYLKIYNRNKDIPLEKFLENSLSEKGIWFEDDTYSEKASGTDYEYSNLGSSLLALAISNAVKESYKEFVKKNIFQPLRMDATSWDNNFVAEDLRVTYYIENGNPIPDYRILTYPDGGIYSSVGDLTKYCQEMIKCSIGQGKILTKKSFLTMTKPQSISNDFPDAICWDLSFAPLIGHAGNEFGSSTLMYFNPKSGIGQILFSNNSIGSLKQEKAFFDIFNLLFKYDFKN
ncbi:serine hydrolase [Gramella aestuarii]|uniref:Serine hydrolase n=2 Tax=Christiangramia aestuarii TaxID=1028746 RepID=A0A7K1LT19_9FLAO|nr:serine hydrolase [Christiangramia aestuarii]